MRKMCTLTHTPVNGPTEPSCPFQSNFIQTLELTLLKLWGLILSIGIYIPQKHVNRGESCMFLM